jgi:hypothetical protein
MKHLLSLAASLKGHIALGRCWPNDREPALMAINQGGGRISGHANAQQAANPIKAHSHSSSPHSHQLATGEAGLPSGMENSQILTGIITK